MVYQKRSPLQKRHYRLRKTLSGTKTRPRLVVSRGNKHIFAQIIDDNQGNTLISVNTFKAKGNKSEIAKKAGLDLAKKANDLKIKEVVFDRGGYKYHGRVEQVAAGAREGGLVF